MRRPTRQNTSTISSHSASVSGRSSVSKSPNGIGNKHEQHVAVGPGGNFLFAFRFYRAVDGGNGIDGFFGPGAVSKHDAAGIVHGGKQAAQWVGPAGGR